MADANAWNSEAEEAALEAEVEIPSGYKEGDAFWVEVNGKAVEVIVPEGCGPGTLLTIEVPSVSELNFEESERIGLDSEPSLQEKSVTELTELEVPLPDVRPGSPFRVQIQGQEFSLIAPENSVPGALLKVAVQSLREPTERHSSSDSGDDLVVPDTCKAGDILHVELDGAPVQVVIPSSCGPGSKLRLRNTTSSSGTMISEMNQSLTQSSLHGKSGQVEEQSQENQPSQTEMDIEVPSGAKPGEVLTIEANGKTFEVTVPENAQPGSVITIGVPEASEPSVAGQNASAETSREVEVEIPEGCHPGDTFAIEVDGQEMEIVVPEGCLPGSVITLDIGEAASAPATPGKQTEVESEPAPLPADPAPLPAEPAPLPAEPAPLPNETVPTEPMEPQDPQDSQESVPDSGEASREVELEIPEGCEPGDTFTVEVDGQEMEIVVPEGCFPGSVITLDIGPASVPTTPAGPTEGKSEEPAPLPAEPVPAEPTEQVQPEPTATQPVEPAEPAEPSEPAEEQMVELEIEVPEGLEAGQVFEVEYEGSTLDVEVPEGCGPGSLITLQVPVQSQSGSRQGPADEVQQAPKVAADQQVLEVAAALAQIEVAPQPEEPTEKPGEQPSEKPAEQPAEKPAQQVAESSSEMPSNSRPVIVTETEAEAAEEEVPLSPSGEFDALKFPTGSEMASGGPSLLATGEFDAMLWRETAAAALAGVEAKLLAEIAEGQAEAADEEPKQPLADEPKQPLADEPKEPLANEPKEPLANEPKEPLADEPKEPLANEPKEPLANEPKEPDEPKEPLADEPKEPEVPKEVTSPGATVVTPDVTEATEPAEPTEPTPALANEVAQPVTVDAPPTSTQPATPTAQAILATVGTLPASTVHSFPTDTIEVGITIPVGTYPGDSFTTEWNGHEVQVVVPAGCSPGSLITVEVPAEPKEMPEEEPKEPSPEPAQEFKEPVQEVLPAPVTITELPPAPQPQPSPEAPQPAAPEPAALQPAAPQPLPLHTVDQPKVLEAGSPIKRPPTLGSGGNVVSPVATVKRREWTQEEMAAGKWLAEAQAVLICCGSGSLAASSGHPDAFRSAEHFAESYPEMPQWGYKTATDCAAIVTDGRLSLYDQWGFWADHTEKVNSMPVDEALLENLSSAIGDKDYFVYSCSADQLFERAGFDSRRIYTPAGSWKYYQCARACSKSSVFESRTAVQEILENLRQFGCVTADCLPKCANCQGDCIPNVRLSDSFCHQKYEQSLQGFISWLEGVAASKSRLAILELDTTFKTSRLASFPMESIAADFPGSALIRFSTERYPFVPAVLERAVGIPADTFKDLPEMLARVKSPDGKALGLAAEKQLRQNSEARKRQEKPLSVEPIHWRRILHHLGESLFNCAYERCM
ncbi:unnamed protein product [Effrenium voratum]|nr:unnamed protein product [Effrenium voratum]